MPAKPTAPKASPRTGTEELDDAPAGEVEDTDPYADPLAVALGHMEEDAAEGTADDADDADSDDDGSDSDAEAEGGAVDSEEDSGADAGENDGDGSAEDADETDDEDDSDADSSEEEDDADGDADDAGADKAAKSKWKEQFDKLSPEAKRIVSGQREALDKARHQRNAAREERDTLRVEVAELKAKVAAQDGQPRAVTAAQDDPLSELVTEADVASAERWARERLGQVEDWIAEARLGYEVVEKLPNGQEKTWTLETLKAEKAYAEGIKSDHAPARRQWLKSYGAAHAAAQKAYPRLFQAGTPEARAATAELEQRPHLLRVPDAELIIGDMLIGRAVREGKLVTHRPGASKKVVTAPAAKAAAKKPPASLSTASPSAPAAKPPRPGAQPRSIAALHKDVLEGTGDPMDLVLAGAAGGE